MSSTFHAQILTPVGSLFEGEVTGVQMPGTQGSFEVLFNHAPIVSTLEKGVVVVRKPDRTLRYNIGGGFVESADNKLTLLAESAELAEEE